MTFEYKNLLLINSPQNKVTLIIAINGKKNKNKLGISCMATEFSDKVTDFTNEQVVQCDAPASQINFNVYT